MVLAGKIFLVNEDADLQLMASKIKDYKAEEKNESDNISLVTQIKDLSFIGDSLQGSFLQDELIDVYYHGKIVHIPSTLEAPFFFVKEKDRIVLTILEKKAKANQIANQLSKILFITTGKIVEVGISPKVFKRFHEKNFEDTKVIFFDDVDLPNINKLSLYGSALGNTSLYLDYLKHGKIWYTVLKSNRYGFIVGITRKGVVVIFSKAVKEDFINYIKEEVIPLIIGTKEG
jgi:hypothetical protein